LTDENSDNLEGDELEDSICIELGVEDNAVAAAASGEFDLDIKPCDALDSPILIERKSLELLGDSSPS